MTESVKQRMDKITFTRLLADRLERARAELRRLRAEEAALSRRVDLLQGLAVEELPDVSHLWPRLLKGVTGDADFDLRFALRDAECLGGAAGVLTLGCERRHFTSLAVLQDPAWQTRLRAILAGLDVVEL